MDGTATNFSAAVSGGGTLALANDYALGSGALNMSSSTLRSADATTRVITNALTLSASMTFGSPGTGDLLFTGDMNTGSAAKTITINNAVTTFSGDLYGASAANANTKNGPGTMVISGTTSYSKPTTVSGGTLLISGNFNGTGNITVSAGGTLAGTGTIAPEVIVTAGGIVEVDPVNIGTLTINNTLLTSGTPPILSLKLNKAAGTNDLMKVTTHLALSTGTQLSLTNLAGTLAAGDSFKLFDSPSITGSFGSIIPVTPGPGLFWDTNTFRTDGTIRVAAMQISTISHLDDGNFQLTGTGPNGAGFRVLASTNVAKPVNNWDVLTNDTFTGGVFSFTDLAATNYLQRFYRVVTP
jgi:autotransporter-associated beta strand protein